MDAYDIDGDSDLDEFLPTTSKPKKPAGAFYYSYSDHSNTNKTSFIFF